MKKSFLIILIITTKIAVAQTANEYFQQATNAYVNQNYEVALKKIEKAIDVDSLNARFFNLKAHSLFELQEFQKSFNTYNSAISKFPNQYFLYLGRGNLLMSFQKFDYAIQDFTKALHISEIDSIKNSIIINRSAAKIKKRDFKGAYQDLMNAYQFDSTNIATLTNLGAVCNEIGKGEETLKYLLKAIEVDSTYYPAYGNIGFRYQELGQYKKAIKYFNKVLEFNPNEPLGYSNRSYNKLKLGDLKGAMTDIEKSINLYPANSYAYRIRALIYIELGKIDNACVDLQTALDKGFTLSYGKEVINLKKKYCN